VTADEADQLARGRQLLGRVGWAAAAFAVLTAAGAAVLPDVAGVLVLAALVSTGTAVLFLGGPTARTGTPARLAIAILLVAAAAGVALAVAVEPVILVGVVYLAYVGALLIRASRRGPLST
jgi:hypothetical protein